MRGCALAADLGPARDLCDPLGQLLHAAGDIDLLRTDRGACAAAKTGRRLLRLRQSLDRHDRVRGRGDADLVEYAQQRRDIDSLWAANMEFLDGSDGLNLHDRSWRIYSKNPIAPPQVITENAQVSNSMIVDGCYVDGVIEHSILSTNVDVQRNSRIVDSVIMPGVKIGKNVVIKRAIIGENAQIGDGAVIEGNEDKIEVVGNSERIGVLPNEN